MSHPEQPNDSVLRSARPENPADLASPWTDQIVNSSPCGLGISYRDRRRAGDTPLGGPLRLRESPQGTNFEIQNQINAQTTPLLGDTSKRPDHTPAVIPESLVLRESPVSRTGRSKSDNHR
jgi:hypothetical protein